MLEGDHVAINEGQQQLSETLSDQVTAIGTSIATSAGMLEMTLEQQEESLRRAIDGSATALDKRLRDSAGAVADRLSTSSDEIAQVAEAFGSRMDVTLNNVASRLDGTGSRIEGNLGALENRIQHGVRAFTPKDARALKATVETWPTTEDYDLVEDLTRLGIGEAMVTLLDVSGRTVMRLLGFGVMPGSQVTEEEIRSLVAEAESAGVLEPEEHRMITAVLRLGDRSVAAVMTPRHEVEMVDLAKSDRQVRKNLRECVHSRVVAYDGTPEEIIGVIQAKDVADALLRRERFTMRSPRMAGDDKLYVYPPL